MATSAALVRRLFTRSIELGRQYGSSGNQEDLYEAFRLMGTGLHCIEGTFIPHPISPRMFSG